MAFDKVRDTKDTICYEILKPMHEIDSIGGEEMRLYVAGIVEQTDAVIIDFSQIVYVNSSGLRELIQIFSLLNKSKKIFLFAGVNEEILKLFSHTNLDRLFTFKNSVEEAIESLT